MIVPWCHDEMHLGICWRDFPAMFDDTRGYSQRPEIRKDLCALHHQCSWKISCRQSSARKTTHGENAAEPAQTLVVGSTMAKRVGSWCNLHKSKGIVGKIISNCHTVLIKKITNQLEWLIWSDHHWPPVQYHRFRCFNPYIFPLSWFFSGKTLTCQVWWSSAVLNVVSLSSDFRNAKTQSHATARWLSRFQTSSLTRLYGYYNILQLWLDWQ